MSGIFINKTIDKVLSRMFILQYTLGEGHFGKVYSATRRKTGDPLALKWLKKTQHHGFSSPEIKSMLKLSGCENVVKLINVSMICGQTILAIDYLQADDISCYMEYMELDEICYYMKNLLIAIDQVHSRGVIHADVKCDNFLYNRTTGCTLLIDFGLSRSCDGGPLKSMNQQMMNSTNADKQLVEDFLSKLNHEECYCNGIFEICVLCLHRPKPNMTVIGTLGYIAPEMILGVSDINRAIDIWSAGSTMLGLLVGDSEFFHPFTNCTVFDYMIDMFGSDRMKESTLLTGRRLMVGDCPGYGIRAHVEDKRRRRGYSAVKVPIGDMGVSTSPVTPPQSRRKLKKAIMHDAYDLLARLLEPNYLQRTSAKQALKHPFFSHYSFNSWYC